MITLPRTSQAGAVRDRLEEKLETEYEGQTERLAVLTAHAAGRRTRHLVDLEAAASSTRLAIAEVAAALRRMAEGTYGRCEACDAEIPTTHLEIEPTARVCPGCRPSPVF